MYPKHSIAGLRICTFLIFVLAFYNSSARGAIGNLPTSVTNTRQLLFLENKGQIVDQHGNQRTDIHFSLPANDVSVFIGKGQLHYQWTKSTPYPPEGGIQIKTSSLSGEDRRGYIIYRLDVELLGANTNSKAVTEEAESYFETYYLPQCPGGVTTRSFKKITYPNIYPFIDWVIYINGNSLKYDFVIHKGGNPSNIKLQYDGATSLNIADGALTVNTPLGTITEEKPYTYDLETKQEIGSGFVLSNNIVSFNIAPHENDLVIDPTIGWGTYYGLPSQTFSGGVAADILGNSYLAGSTTNTSTIATFGAHQTVNNGNPNDAFIVKFNLNGARLWATYFGGESGEEVHGAVCDDNGNICIAGSTYSQMGIVSSTSVHQNTNGGTGFSGASARDAFLIKFNSSGTRLWSTYYGGSNIDYPNAVACDKDGNIFMGGFTMSTNGNSIVTSNGHQASVGNCFLVKFNPAGVRQWGTYYGTQTFAEEIFSIACDTSGNVFIGGRTSSYTHIGSSNGYSPMFIGGIIDGFFAKFNSAGQRQWGSYYGGNNEDGVYAIACDRYNNVFIGGTTNSASGIATPGTHKTIVYGMNAFLCRFNATTGQRIWGTYYGSNTPTPPSTPSNSNITAIHIGHDRKIYVAGNTIDTQPNSIATPGNYQTINPPGEGAFLAKFNFNGQREWGTYFSGDSMELNTKMAYGRGKIFISGQTQSPTNIATANGYMNFLNGSPPPSPPNPFPWTAFCTQFEADTAVYFDEIFWDTTVCLADTLFIKYDVTNHFRPGNVFTLQLSDASGSFANPTNINSMATTGGGIFKYWIPDTLTTTIGYRIRIVSSTFPDTSWDNGKDIRVSDYAHPVAIAQFPICANGTLVLVDNGTGPSSTTYKWTGPSAFSIGQRNYNRPNVQATDSGFYVLTADNYSCITKDSVHVLIYSKPNKPVIHSNGPVCVGDTLKVWATTSTPGISQWTWQKPSGYAPFTTGDTTIPVAALTDAGIYKAVAIAGGCPSDMDSILVVVEPKTTPTVQIGANPSDPGPWVDVQFSITGSSNEGNGPTYQWIKNGVDIPNATAKTYTAKTTADIQTGDSICVRMTSSANCATPQGVKSCIGININLGIQSPASTGTFILFPNPNNGSFTLNGKTANGKAINLKVMNVVGQVVFEDAVNPVNRLINKQLNITDLPEGVYLLHMTTDEGMSVIKFTIKK